MAARRFAIPATLVAVLMAGCGDGLPIVDTAFTSKPSTGSTPSASDTSAPINVDDGLPDGWRWESYRDVEVGVPGDWGWGNSSQRMGQWCVDHEIKPTVGRPGWSTAAGCFTPDGTPSPGTLIAENGRFVGFGTTVEGVPTPAAEGDRVIVTVGQVTVAVQAEPALREQITATIRKVRADHNGCPIDEPISREPARRPSPAIAVGSLTGVQRVSVCKYEIRNRTDVRYVDGPSLLSSLQLTGTEAQRAAAAIAAAPEGGGPDEPSRVRWRCGTATTSSSCTSTRPRAGRRSTSATQDATTTVSMTGSRCAR